MFQERGQNLVDSDVRKSSARMAARVRRRAGVAGLPFRNDARVFLPTFGCAVLAQKEVATFSRALTAEGYDGLA